MQVNWNCLYEQGTQAAFSHFYAISYSRRELELERARKN